MAPNDISLTEVMKTMRKYGEIVVEQCDRCGATDPKAHVMDHIVTDYIAEDVVKHRLDGKLCLNCRADHDSDEFRRVLNASTREFLRSENKA